MKKVISLIKKGAKAYFRQAAKTYAWTSTGTIPVGIQLLLCWSREDTNKAMNSRL